MVKVVRVPKPSEIISKCFTCNKPATHVYLSPCVHPTWEALYHSRAQVRDSISELNAYIGHYCHCEKCANRYDFSRFVALSEIEAGFEPQVSTQIPSRIPSWFDQIPESNEDRVTSKGV